MGARQDRATPKTHRTILPRASLPVFWFTGIPIQTPETRPRGVYRVSATFGMSRLPEQFWRATETPHPSPRVSQSQDIGRDIQVLRG
jgi:hypothetical protein